MAHLKICSFVLFVELHKNYVDNTFTCLCHDCNRLTKIHRIGNAFFDKVEEIL